MDLEIKRILKLSTIPGFKLSQAEIAKLEAWKAEQVDVVPVKKKTRKAPKGYKLDEEIGDKEGPTAMPIVEEKVTEQNIIDSDEKTLG